MRRSDLRNFPLQSSDDYLNYKEYPHFLSNNAI